MVVEYWDPVPVVPVVVLAPCCTVVRNPAASRTTTAVETATASLEFIVLRSPRGWPRY
jgi:hypothetical protein